MGEQPATLDPDRADSIIERATQDRHISAEGFPEWAFDPARDLIFDYDERLPGHTNAMRFTAYDASNLPLLTRVYYSIGGGFVADETEIAATPSAQAGEACAVPVRQCDRDAGNGQTVRPNHRRHEDGQ